MNTSCSTNFSPCHGTVNHKSKSDLDPQIEYCLKEYSVSRSTYKGLKRKLKRIQLEAGAKQKEQQTQIIKLNTENAVLKFKISKLIASLHASMKELKGDDNDDSSSELEPDLPLTREIIDDFLTDGLYTFDMYKQGVKGLVKFFDLLTGGNTSVSDPTDGAACGVNVIRNYNCLDCLSKMYERLNEDGEWVLDNNGEFILENLYDAIRESGIVDRYWDQVLHDKSNLEARNATLDRIKLVTFGVEDVSTDQTRKLKLHRQFMKELNEIIPEVKKY
jgi:hypothetical protein